jgi:hypothetical protein
MGNAARPKLPFLMPNSNLWWLGGALFDIAEESSNRQQICERLRGPLTNKLGHCGEPAVQNE